MSGRGLATGLVLALMGCGPSGPSGAGRVREGAWGGAHAALTVTPTGAEAEFDCAHGRVEEPLLLDARGRFDAAGVYVAEHGGPIQEGEVEQPQGARYRGTSEGRSLTLTVHLVTSGDDLGPFALVLGGPPRVVKCLTPAR